MKIVINLTPELEEKLHKKDTHWGQDISVVAAEILISILESETQDLEETVKDIQQGLDNFKTGNFDSFNEFANK